MIVVEYAGLGRYSVTDHLALSAIQNLLGASLDDFQQKFSETMGEAVRLGGSLFRVVDELLLHIFEEHEDAIVEQQDGEVVVSAEILEAKEKGGQ